MYNDILQYVQNLSVRICEELKVPLPKIFIQIIKGTDFSGWMVPRRKRSEIHIKLEIPYDATLKKCKYIITAITVHEHCHYEDSFKMSTKNRETSINEYVTSPGKRKIDEYNTWKCTKKVAQALGIWTRELYKEIKQIPYTSTLKFK